MLKISLLFKKNLSFTGQQLENSYNYGCEIFRVLILYEFEYIGKFSNLHYCTFNSFAPSAENVACCKSGTMTLGPRTPSKFKSGTQDPP